MIFELTQDFHDAATAMPQEHPKRRSIEVLYRVLRLSAHAIVRDPLNIASQLCGRVPNADRLPLGRLFADLEKAGPAPWVRPLSCSMSAPEEPLVQTLAVFPAGVTAVATSPDGRFGAAGTTDCELRVWNLATGREVMKADLDEDGAVQRQVEAGLLGRAARCISFLGFAEDGRQLVAVLPNGKTDIWATETGARVNRRELDHAPLRVSPDGKRLLCWSRYEGLWSYDLATGACDCVISQRPEGARLERAAVGHQRALLWWERTGHAEPQVWDFRTGSLLTTLPEQKGSPAGLDIAGNGTRAAFGRVYGQGVPLSVEVWDLDRGECVAAIDTGDQHAFPIALSDDGATLVFATPDGMLHVCRLASGQQSVLTEGHLDEPSLSDTTAAVQLLMSVSGRTLGLSADGRRLLSGSRNGTVRLWSLISSAYDRRDMGAQVSGVAIAPDGKRLLSVHVDGKAEIRPLPTGTGSVQLVRPASSGMEILGRNLSRVLDRVMQGEFDASDNMAEDAADDSNEPDTVAHGCALEQALFTPGGRCGITVSRDNARVWDAVNGRCLKVLEKGGFSPRLVRSTPDARLLISVGTLPPSGDSRSIAEHVTLAAWDLASGEWRSLATIHKETSSSDRPLHLCLAPDGRRAVWGLRGDPLRVWDLPRACAACRLGDQTARATALAVSADGCLVLSGDDTGEVAVDDIETGKCLRRLEGHEDGITSIAGSPDARYVVSAGRDCRIRLWHVQDGRCVSSTGRLSGPAGTIRVAPDGRRVIGIVGKELNVWQLPALKRLASYAADELLEVVDASCEGSTVVVGDRSGRVHALALENMPAGPLVVTCWTGKDGSQAFGCPSCRSWTMIRPGRWRLREIFQGILRSVHAQADKGIRRVRAAGARTGEVLACPGCGRQLRLNAFVLHADWRPIAAGWNAEGGPGRLGRRYEDDAGK